MCWNIQQVNYSKVEKCGIPIRTIINNYAKPHDAWACFILENKTNPDDTAKRLAQLCNVNWAWAQMGGKPGVAENLIVLHPATVTMVIEPWTKWQQLVNKQLELAKTSFKTTQTNQVAKLSVRKTDGYYSRGKTAQRLVEATKASVDFRNPMLCTSTWNYGKERCSFLVLHAPGPGDTSGVLKFQQDEDKDEKSAEEKKIEEEKKSRTYAKLYMTAVLQAAEDDPAVEFIIGDCNVYKSLNSPSFNDLMEGAPEPTTMGTGRIDRIYWRGSATPANGIFPHSSDRKLVEQVSDHFGIYVDVPMQVPQFATMGLIDSLFGMKPKRKSSFEEEPPRKSSFEEELPRKSSFEEELPQQDFGKAKKNLFGP